KEEIMRLVSYHSGASRSADGGSTGVASLGIVTPAGVLDVAAAAQRHGVAAPAAEGGGSAPAGGLTGAAAFYAAGETALPALAELVELATDGPFVGPLDELNLAPTVPAPGKILCIGLNYRRHAAESGMAEPQEPVLFSKFGNTLAPQGATVDITGL